MSDAPVELPADHKGGWAGVGGATWWCDRDCWCMTGEEDDFD